MDEKTLRIDPANADQARAWDGEEGAFWAEYAEQFDLAMSGYHGRLLEAAAIGPADHVLDIGCGTGQTTRDAARRAGEGAVLGVDLSAEMLRVARRAAEREGLGNVRFEQADAQVHPFPEGSFDVAVSRTGTMFFADPVAAFRNIRRALRPGGRLVQLVWQAPSENPWLLELRAALAAGRDLPMPPVGGPGPFGLAERGRVREVLAAAGFAEPRFEDLRAPMHFGADAPGAFRFVTGLLGWMLDGLDTAARDRALDDLRGTLEAHATPDGVLYPSATWLITTHRA
ncbi:class I SAM-dependent methyltransferase [Thermoactinospora rubra]|uniref:class I SAM-dependent methyltransferase n=1 Tax=Thermoactinospora rubra TaxID=1088767 RepID=UPI000A11E528|nr:class I SAM-dependent methyltransferase [Thermoactinospora rubra]